MASGKNDKQLKIISSKFKIAKAIENKYLSFSFYAI